MRWECKERKNTKGKIDRHSLTHTHTRTSHIDQRHIQQGSNRHVFLPYNWNLLRSYKVPKEKSQESFLFCFTLFLSTSRCQTKLIPDVQWSEVFTRTTTDVQKVQNSALSGIFSDCSLVWLSSVALRGVLSVPLFFQ